MVQRRRALRQQPGRELRLCHLADLHLGFRKYNRLTPQGWNQREVDVGVSFHEAIDRVIAVKPHLVLVAGDVFHSVRPSNAVLAFCFREFRRLRRALPECPVVVVAGNHETPRRSDTGSALRLLAEIDDVHVADSEAVRFTFPKLQTAVMCVPHASIGNPGVEFRADDEYRYNLLVMHAQVLGEWVSDFGGAELERRDFALHEWDYVALGHVHLRRAVADNALYAGAIDHTSTNIWAEVQEPKGFVEVKLPDGERRWHDLTSPRDAVVVAPVDAAGMAPDDVTATILTHLRDVPGGITGKLVRLDVLNISREVMRQLDHRAFRPFRLDALHLALEFRVPVVTEEGVSDGTTTERRSLADELHQFSVTWAKANAIDAPALEQLLAEYLKRVEDEAPTP